jgi:thioredoxin 1
MGIIHIENPEQFKKEVVEYKGLVVVDFRAEWCGPCRMIGPVMEELAHDNEATGVKVAKINVDNNPELAGAFQVSSIPVIFFMKDGQPVDTIIGANPKGVYQNKIDELLAEESKIVKMNDENDEIKMAA